MKLDVQIVHCADEVGREAWDRLSAGRPYGSFDWYRFGEKAMGYAKPIYILVTVSGEPVARATFWLTGREVLPIPSAVASYALGLFFRRRPLLLCQSPPSGIATSGLVLPSRPLRDAALRAIVEAVLAIGAEYKVSFCAFSYLEPWEANLMAWPNSCLSTAVPGPGTRLTIAWPELDGYLAHLGKKQRYNFRRNCRLGTESGIVVSRHRTVQDVERALELHGNVNRRYGARTEPWVRGTLEHAGMADAVWLAAWRNDRLVGCELVLGDGGAWTVTILGLDYAERYVYYLLGWEDIRYAIERKGRNLRWGSESYAVKRRLGFHQETSNHLVVMGIGRWFEGLGRWMAARWG
jgi:hypothetical protein